MLDMPAPTAQTRRKLIPAPEPLAVNVPNAALMLGIGIRSAWALVADGALESAVVAGRRVVLIRSIKKLLNEPAD